MPRAAKKTTKKKAAKAAPKRTPKKRPGKRSGKPTGRPSLIHDKTLVDELLENVRKGCPLKASAEAVGIAAYTLQEWRRRGDEAIENALKSMGLDSDDPVPLAQVLEKIPERERPFASFADRLACARARAKVQLHNVLEGFTRCKDKKIALDAAKFLAARRHPEDYGRRDALELSGNEDKPVGVKIYLPKLEGQSKPSEG